jgi:eukaryotic-like serine/threonine-protein kinase
VTDLAFSAGAVIADKYRVIRTIGQGGMGVVLAADHLHLGRQVAIKVLKGDSSQISLARFSREAQAVAKIGSQHVCQVFDVGMLPSGSPYMVMELLDGSDLADLAKGGHRFEVAEVVDYVLQACQALAEAHTKHIVHRDLKPGNLFLARQPDGTSIIKLLDFGISKSVQGPDTGLTQTDSVVGSPRFMSPEQLTSAKDADHRADIWSLGVVIQELLTGKAVFPSNSIAELFVKILQQDPPSVRQDRPDVSELFDGALGRCFEKDREDRYANVAEMALALAPFGTASAQRSLDVIVRLYEATGWRRPAQAAAPAAQPAPAASVQASPAGQPLQGTLLVASDDTAAMMASVAAAAEAQKQHQAQAVAQPYAGAGQAGAQPYAATGQAGAQPYAATGQAGAQPYAATGQGTPQQYAGAGQAVPHPYAGAGQASPQTYGGAGQPAPQQYAAHAAMTSTGAAQGQLAQAAQAIGATSGTYGGAAAPSAPIPAQKGRGAWIAAVAAIAILGAGLAALAFTLGSRGKDASAAPSAQPSAQTSATTQAQATTPAASASAEPSATALGTSASAEPSGKPSSSPSAPGPGAIAAQGSGRPPAPSGQTPQPKTGGADDARIGF